MSSIVFFQAEDGIRDLVRSRGLGDVYKRQALVLNALSDSKSPLRGVGGLNNIPGAVPLLLCKTCLLYTSDAADERSSVDLGGRRIIKKKIKLKLHRRVKMYTKYEVENDNSRSLQNRGEKNEISR